MADALHSCCPASLHSLASSVHQCFPLFPFRCCSGYVSAASLRQLPAHIPVQSTAPPSGWRWHHKRQRFLPAPALHGSCGGAGAAGRLRCVFRIQFTSSTRTAMLLRVVPTPFLYDLCPVWQMTNVRHTSPFERHDLCRATCKPVHIPMHINMTRASGRCSALSVSLLVMR